MRPLSGPLAAILTTVFAASNATGAEQALTENEQGLAKLAIDALAAELQVAPEGIEVDTVSAVDWPDSSIGCPQPGRSYLQVITPGHKITLRANGQTYVIHEAKGSAFVCHRTKAVGDATPQLELEFGPQAVAARKDLAERLRVPESEIRVVSGEPHTWEDASLGCPERGVSYRPERVTGWVLTLKHGVNHFTYHTDLDRTIPCPGITAD